MWRISSGFPQKVTVKLKICVQKKNNNSYFCRKIKVNHNPLGKKLLEEKYVGNLCDPGKTNIFLDIINNP